MLNVLASPRFVDRAPAEVAATLLDEGQYLCSERTMYRILAANQPVRERRNQRDHPQYTKPVEKHIAMLSLYFVHYNFCRIHKSLRVTPAMEAGLTNELRDMEWIVDLIDARAPKPSRPKTYRKRQISN